MSAIARRQHERLPILTAGGRDHPAWAIGQRNRLAALQREAEIVSRSTVGNERGNRLAVVRPDEPLIAPHVDIAHAMVAERTVPALRMIQRLAATGRNGPEMVVFRSAGLRIIGADNGQLRAIWRPAN